MPNGKIFLKLNWPKKFRKVKDKDAQCYICGNVDNLDNEHVIPKFLLKGLGDIDREYVQLPSCKTCNNKVKKNIDERVILSMTSCSFDSDSSDNVFKSVCENFSDGHFEGLMKDLFRNHVGKVNLHSKSGLHIGDAVGMKPPTYEIMEGFLQNIAKGLMTFHSDKYYDWSLYDFKWDIQQRADIHRKPFVENVWEKGQYGAKWGDAFCYKGSFYEDGKSASMWVLQFYQSFVAYIIVMTKEIAEKIKRIETKTRD